MTETVRSLWHMGVTLAYVGAQLLLALYGLHRYRIVFLFRKARAQPQAPPAAPRDWPAVTVQLPIHNEIYVVGRLVDAVCRLDYPRDRLQVQILDDSTDETAALAVAAVERWRRRGVDVSLRHRLHRDGFKAGALADGLRRARGDLIAVFDADFVPPPDFLRRVVPHFADPQVGMVQTRWGHLNRDSSRLTVAQAVLLDGHFVVEHGARSAAGLFFNFNGTAGVWRRRCIEEAGGWQQDTLTEDLDLSYRAQLGGWRFVYLPEVVAPGELPMDMNAFKSQQRRWAKGSLQTACKILPRLWRSRLPWRVKIEASYHLTSNLAYLLLLLSSLLMLPVMTFPPSASPVPALLLHAAVFLCGTAAFCLFFICGQGALGRGFWASVRLLPTVLALGVGLSLNNGRAVLEALWPRVGHWERTPKYALERLARRGPRLRYQSGGRMGGLAEMALAGYFLVTAAYAWQRGYLAALPFLALLLAGFAYVGWRSMRPARQRVGTD